MDISNTKQNKRTQEKHNCKFEYEYTELDYLDSPFGYRCTKECIQGYIALQKEIIKSIKARIKIYESLKIFEDGTVPYFDFTDIMSYYQGSDNELYNKDIQDLFKINLLDIDIPFWKKRTDKPPSNK